MSLNRKTTIKRRFIMAKDSVAKSKPHLPIMGVGPAYVISIVLLSSLSIFVDTTLIHLPRPTSSKYFYSSSASCLSYLDFSFIFLPSKPKLLAQLKKTLLLLMASTPLSATPSIPPGYLSVLAPFFFMEARTSPSRFFLSSGSL